MDWIKVPNLYIPSLEDFDFSFSGYNIVNYTSINEQYYTQIANGELKNILLSGKYIPMIIVGQERYKTFVPVISYQNSSYYLGYPPIKAKSQNLEAFLKEAGNWFNQNRDNEINKLLSDAKKLDPKYAIYVEITAKILDSQSVIFDLNKNMVALKINHNLFLIQNSEVTYVLTCNVNVASKALVVLHKGTLDFLFDTYDIKLLYPGIDPMDNHGRIFSHSGKAVIQLENHNRATINMGDHWEDIIISNKNGKRYAVFPKSRTVFLLPLSMKIEDVCMWYYSRGRLICEKSRLKEV